MTYDMTSGTTIKRFLSFLLSVSKSNKKNLILTEFIIYSVAHWIAGKYDCKNILNSTKTKKKTLVLRENMLVT